ncbi:MAG: hypothetical protein J6X02_03750 [Bacilli bacterium]|nr:hypothetical protein [Bacilli bacterium]
MKKGLLVGILIIIIGVTGYFIYNATTKNDNKKEQEKVIYAYEIKDNGDITFYKNDKFISEFKCNGKDCDIDLFNYEDVEYLGANYDDKIYIYDEKVLIAQCEENTCDFLDNYGGLYFQYNDDNENKKAYGSVLIYDIPTGKYKKYENIVSIKPSSEVKVLELLNNEVKLIDASGKIDRNVNPDSLEFSCYEGCWLTSYDYEKNLIAFKDNGKYGIQKLTTGETLLEAKYDNLWLSYGNYFVARLNNKDNLYNLDDYTAITKNGYDNIFFAKDDLVIVYNNKELSFINLKEEKIIEETIHIDNILPQPPKIMDGVNVYIEEDDKDICTIEISDGKTLEKAKTSTYTYNIKTHELTKVND